MQIEFDLTDHELENLKRKIDGLDPVAQAEKVVDYLGKNYTQKQLGEKLGKTRDWVAKRVQFIRALEKLPKSEQEELKNLARHRKISVEVIILVADFPSKQRQTILSRHPTVSEARRLIDEYRQSQSSEARLRVLEGQLSKAYIELERVFSHVFLLSVVTKNAFCQKIISPSLTKKVEEFIDKNWYKNYRFGLEVQINSDRAMDDEMLQQRIAWLELPERERIKILEKTVVDCQHLSLDVVKELESQARQVPSLIDKVKSLQLELGLLKIDKAYGKTTDGVSIKFGNGIPPIVLNIAGDQFKMLHRALAVAFHPDKHPEDSQQYAELMKTINSWYDKFLGKNVKRKSI